MLPVADATGKENNTTTTELGGMTSCRSKTPGGGRKDGEGENAFMPVLRGEGSWGKTCVVQK